MSSHLTSSKADFDGWVKFTHVWLLTNLIFSLLVVLSRAPLPSQSILDCASSYFPTEAHGP